MNPYLEVLESCRDTQFLHVERSRGAIKKIARKWMKDPLPIPSWREPVFPREDGETFVNFLGVGNAINFCFTNPKNGAPFITKIGEHAWTGAFAMWAVLEKALIFGDQGLNILDSRHLAELSFIDLMWFFRQSSPIPLRFERLQCLRSAGRAMRGTSFAALFEKCGYRAFHNGKGIVEQIVRRDAAYADTTQHERAGILLPFHKRANLLVMMYHGRALASNGALPPIEDAADLTPPADYDVPRALRHLGILTYSDELARTVDAGEEIPKDSEEEQEIRLQTVFAMRDLCDELSRVRGEPVTIAALDYKVWSAGRQVSALHHRTATTAY